MRVRVRVRVRVMVRVRVRNKVRVSIRVSVRAGDADCCIQTAGKSDKMRVNHVIKTDQWLSAPLRILSCPPSEGVRVLLTCFGDVERTSGLRS